ncbi:hypothetical protein ACBQ16_14960 [Halopseudomonas bauzanensis]|uniref:hypothetical protein n=1 Tax=Halopseudomonas bauzanensis TaxID=653930 RepID=UPI0035240C48
MLALSKRGQLAVGIVLVLLMAITRGSHFSTVNLPGASWAAFFLAGVLLRPRWAFPLLFLQAVFMDVMTVGWNSAGHHCMTLAYWMLLPAYGSLWLGGRLYAGWHREQPISLLLLAGVMAASALVCQTFSSGGFYWFSGRYPDPTLLGTVERLANYYPKYLGSLAFYVAIAAVLYIGWQLLARQRLAEGRKA